MRDGSTRPGEFILGLRATVEERRKEGYGGGRSSRLRAGERALARASTEAVLTLGASGPVEAVGKPARSGTAAESHADGSCSGCSALGIGLRPVPGGTVRL
jgi:hypothetical protein